eukprot:GSMAST32.ASY1.ANO1.2290.1 assembled CDS
MGESKPTPAIMHADDSEKELASSLFGGPALKFGEESDSMSDSESGNEGDAIFTGGTSETINNDFRNSSKSGGKRKLCLKPAWNDSDDDRESFDISATNRLRKLRKTEEETVVSGAEYARRLRSQFCKMNPATLKFASAIADDMTNGLAVDLFKTSASMLRSSTAAIRKEQLSVLRVKDANAEEISDAVVQSVEFHTRRSLMLTAGLDKKLRLFDIDGKFNRKIQGVVFPDMPIRTATFSGCGSSAVGSEQIIATGRRPFFYTVDIASGSVLKIPRIAGRKEKSLEKVVASSDGRWIAFLGNDGYVILVSGKTKQWIANLKMNGAVRAVAFTPDCSELLTVGTDGDVYRWSLNDRRCIHRHADEGGMTGSAIAVSPNGKYYAIGSEAGVVNIYDAEKASKEATPVPTKAIMNLTTAIDGLTFNHDSQLLSIRSQRIKDQFKIVHCPSFTTYQNWPTSNTPLGYVSSTSFSPHSGFLSIGNDKGKVLLYRLQHYTQA